jgi:PAS domain S-box-containing protein
MGWETVLGTRPALRVLVVGDRAGGLVPLADAGPDEVVPSRVPDLPAALAVLARGRFDCVLLDLTGAEPSGGRAVRALRDRAGTAAVVVVCEQPSDAAAALEDLADLVLGPDELAGAGVGALRQAAEHARLAWRLPVADRPARADVGPEVGYVVPAAREAPDGPVDLDPDDLLDAAEDAAEPPAAAAGRGVAAMFTLADDGVVTSWTAGAAELYGYTAAEVVGRDVAVLHPLSSTDVGPSLTGARAGGEVRDHDTVCRTRDGRLLPVTLDAAPHVDGNGKPVGWVVVVRTAVGRRSG